LARYGHGTPDDWLERNVYSRFTWQGVAIMLGIDWILFGWAGLAVWGVQMMWIPFFAAGVINGIGHYWGYRNYDSPDAATNIVPWGILIGGEELHNNHHTYPTSAKLSSKWYEFDLGWVYIRALEALGLAKVRRVAPVPKVARPKACVDLETLQAVISYRYDLLGRYARGLRDADREGLRQMRVSAAERRRFKALRAWLRKSDVQAIPPAQQQTLRELLAHSRVIGTLIEMRGELAAIWSRSAASREQMLAHLQDWIARAEASGIRVLQETALRIRSYAPAAT
jgi:stearoyl-CoA desaturase (delta-9 desaturase)